jgi:phosphate transport system protein
MERHFDEQLLELKSHLMQMSALTEVMIADAIKTVIEREAYAVAPVYEREGLVNRMEIEIDETCQTLIALHQPTASDLRFIVGSFKTNAELERLADEAVNIVHRSERLLHAEPLPLLDDVIPEMGALARSMVRDSLLAFVGKNVTLAQTVLDRDDLLDNLRKKAAGLLMDYMAKDTGNIPRAVDLLLISRSIEHIGDHATNIAEITFYVVKGEDIRHPSANQKRPASPPPPANP